MTKLNSSGSKKLRIAMWVGLWLFSLVLTVLLVTWGKAAPDTVFFGDSLTEEWPLPTVNFGVYGNTTNQMLARFNEVTDGNFSRVVLLGGTNDVLLGIDPDITIRNLHQMIHLATEKKLETIVGELPPIYKDSGIYQPRVAALNARIRQEVQSWKASGAPVELVDYNSVLNGELDGYASDGVHLRHRAYVRMELQLLRVVNFFWRKK